MDASIGRQLAIVHAHCTTALRVDNSVHPWNTHGKGSTMHSLKFAACAQNQEGRSKYSSLYIL